MATARQEQVAAVRRLVREQVAAVEHLEPAAVRSTLEALLAARKELREDLKRWMRTIKNPRDRFTAHQLRVMLRSLEGTIDALGIKMRDWVDLTRKPVASALDRSMLEGLRKGTRATGALAVEALEDEITRLGHIFGMSIVGPQIDAVNVLARGDELLFKSGALPSSIARYAGRQAEDLRFQLSVGVARGETFEQLAQRLRRVGGPTGPVAVRGIFGTPSAIIEDIPEGLFQRYYHFAQRLVRTEMMNAYNVQHRAAIAELNDERPRDEPKWLRRCDAAADGRVCAECRRRDGEILRTREGPPWHPNCRCVELAWRADWPEIGEISSGVKGAAERSSPAL